MEKTKIFFVGSVILVLALMTFTIFISLSSNDEQTQNTIVRENPIPVAVEGFTKFNLSQIKLEQPIYTEGDLKATFSEQDFGEKIVEFHLKSHPSVDYVRPANVVEDVVMWYDLNSSYKLSGLLGEPKFIDMNTNQEVQRDWSYVFWGDEDYLSPTYSCSEVFNASIGKNSKVCVEDGFETKTRKAWLDYPTRNIEKGNIRIGIKVETRIGDYIDGIWVIGGRQIGKHATWSVVEKIDTNFVLASGSALTDYQGVSFNVTTANVYLINATKTNDASSEVNWQLFDANGTFLKAGTWSTNNANVTHLLASGHSYYLVSNANGGSRNQWRDNSPPFVRFGTLANIVTGVHFGTSNATAVGFIFSNLTFGTPLDDMVITLLYPNNNSNFSTSLNVSANVTNQTSVGISSVVATIQNSNGTVASNQSTNGTLFSGVYNFTATLPDGTYNWTIYAFGSNGAKYNATNSSLTFNVDTTSPNVNISYPSPATNFTYLRYGDNLTLNATAGDTHLSVCKYDYNFTNTTYSCTSGVLASNNFALTNQKNISVWANDTFGRNGTANTNWTFDLFDFMNYTYDLNVTESSSTTFTGTFETGSAITSAYLQYNNSNNSVSITSLGSNKYQLSATVTSPFVSADTNKSWFFWVNNINATSRNQTVTNVAVGNCSTYTFPIAYYYLEDELTQALINNSNSSIEFQIDLRTSSGELVTTVNNTYTGNSTPSVCSQTNLSLSGLLLWEQSRYGSTNYQYESHNIQNASITSPANFTLLDLPSASATVFRISYRSETFLPVENAVLDIQRKYIGQTVYKTTEAPLTDDNGEASASFDLNAVTYRVVVRLNGTTIATFENPAVACENPVSEQCFVTLNERQSVNLIDTIDNINDFSYGLDQDNRTITLTFEIPSGTSKNVSMRINQSTILGNSTACLSYSLASSGQIQCTISLTLGDVFADINVSSNGQTIVLGTTTIVEDRSQYFGTDNIVLTFFLVLSIVLLFVSDAIATLIGLVIGLITSSLMLFLNSGSVFGTTSVVMYIIIVVILLIVKIARRDSRT